jgi:hypothetical protein
VDTPEPRALLQRTFLGHHPLETVHSPYISPASARVLRAYGHPADLLTGRNGKFDGTRLGAGAIALAAESVLAVAGPSAAMDAEAGMAAISGMGTSTNGNRVPMIREQPRESVDSLAMTSTAANSPDTSPMPPFANPPSIHSRPGPPSAAPRRMTELDLSARAVAAAHISNAHGLAAKGQVKASRPQLQSTLTFLNPTPRDPSLRASLFGRFPKTFVLVGDAERLEREV